MSTHKAAVLESFDQPLKIVDHPTPSVGPGEALIRPLAISLTPALKEIYNGSRGYLLELPLVPGSACIGRVIAVGPDATTLKPGQLVYVDPTIHARDDADVAFLLGLHGGMTAESSSLMKGPWRHGCFAEVAKVPLENVVSLDDGFSYSVEELANLPNLLVPFGGLDDAGVEPGSVVIVAPATGRFGSAAVVMALAMGAKVIAVGRNQGKLEGLEKILGAETGKRLKTVKVEGDEEEDAKAIAAAVGTKGADVYIDFSPTGMKEQPKYIKACLAALGRGGVCSLMGGVFGDIPINYLMVMFKEINIRGKFMYDNRQIKKVLRMLEAGNLKLGKAIGCDVVARYGLEDASKALDEANKPENEGWGKNVILLPNKE